MTVAAPLVRQAVVLKDRLFVGRWQVARHSQMLAASNMPAFLPQRHAAVLPMMLPRWGPHIVPARSLAAERCWLVRAVRENALAYPGRRRLATTALGRECPPANEVTFGHATPLVVRVDRA